MATKRIVKKITKTSAMPVPLTIEKSSVKDKLKQPKIFVPLIIIILIITAFLLKGFFIAALVNGEPIARFSVIRELEKQSGRQALSALVNQTLILQEARRKNVQATEKEINDSVKQIEKNKETLPSDLKEDEIKKGVREQLRQQKLASKSQEWLTGLEKNAKINYFVNY